MDTKIWHKTTFSKESLPLWNCPHCHNGILKLADGKSHFEETESSKDGHKEDYWEPEFIRYVFSGFLECSTCHELVAFVGDGQIEHDGFYDHENDIYMEDYGDVFTPIYFSPALQIFKIPNNCPNDINKEINSSFSLFWNDLPSCANKIRTSLEMIMDQQKVKKSYVSGGKRRALSLHKRIENFKLIKPDIADFLLAIKWIGNTGSHTGKLERIDVLEAYELLELSLNKLYDDTEIKLSKISKEIIKRKGTRKRKS